MFGNVVFAARACSEHGFLGALGCNSSSSVSHTPTIIKSLAENHPKSSSATPENELQQNFLKGACCILLRENAALGASEREEAGRVN